MISRLQEDSLKNQLSSSKILLVSGPQDSGKSTLILKILDDQNWSYVNIDCTNKKIRKNLLSELIDLTNPTQFIVLNNAQFLSDLQTILESSLSDEIRPKIICLCSFTPAISDELNEALKMENCKTKLFAPSFYEAAQYFGLPQESSLLEERLIYGNHEGVLSDLDQGESYLNDLIKEVVKTNLGATDRINKSDKMTKVLQQFAFQIGDTISYNEIGERCGVDNETVERYVDLFEKAYILIILPSFHTEQRYELKKAHSIYFFDNGIRNALIKNFNPIDLRNDTLALWKNYLISERIKWMETHGIQKKYYFWKTHTKQFMDLVEVGENQTRAYKVDWDKRKKIKFPKSFQEAYPDTKLSTLNKSTYWNFLSKKN